MKQVSILTMILLMFACNVIGSKDDADSGSKEDTSKLEMLQGKWKGTYKYMMRSGDGYGNLIMVAAKEGTAEFEFYNKTYRMKKVQLIGGKDDFDFTNDFEFIRNDSIITMERSSTGPWASVHFRIEFLTPNSLVLINGEKNDFHTIYDLERIK
ncbi:MAG: hypothetical protein LCH58_00985 [Bacteroidetes bacterium]|uniref:hypothetical protein n=1 Tax=Phnomibacter sp. TaxID=2836217 RepID=UPI002FDD2B7A|nr:hypothetical protein [Bacteroidota bacterium]